MTRAGILSRQSNRNVKIVLAIMVGWVLLVFTLVAWWGSVVYRQGQHIAALEQQTGLSVEVAHEHLEKTQRMLLGESATFFFLLVTLTAVLAWFYYRDIKRSRSLQAFFASVTHELKTPLTSIRLQAESIAEQSEQQTLVSRLLEDTQRLEAQVERTLELARIEGGGPLLTQTLSVQGWLQRNLSTLLQFQEKKISLEFKIPNPDLSVRGDPSAIQMILRNLIENSIRHAKLTPVHATLEVTSQKQETSWHYSDNGKGFSGPSQKLGRLFYRGEESQGAGVGLYLIQILMERMGGEAEFYSGEGKGFTAVLKFQAGEDHEG